MERQHPPPTRGPGVVSGPNSVPVTLPSGKPEDLLLRTRSPPTTDGNPSRPTPPTGHVFVVLLRKEVIQPHLPVRLPCYDFVPIISPAFGDCLQSYEWLAHRLQALPTFMT